MNLTPPLPGALRSMLTGSWLIVTTRGTVSQFQHETNSILVFFFTNLGHLDLKDQKTINIYIFNTYVGLVIFTLLLCSSGVIPYHQLLNGPLRDILDINIESIFVISTLMISPTWFIFIWGLRQIQKPCLQATYSI